ncbi:peptidase M16 family protein, partial [Haematococcus lacustris]
YDLRYYVRPCSKPKERAALALVVKVGSVVEEDSEAGVAHIVEHLAFNATESFSNHQIVKFLESIGAGFGACQNAYTSSDETCYQLVLPVSSAASTVTTDSTAATATASITASTPPAAPPAVPSTAGAAEAEELTAAVEAEEGGAEASAGATGAAEAGVAAGAAGAEVASGSGAGSQDLKLLQEALKVLAEGQEQGPGAGARSRGQEQGPGAGSKRPGCAQLCAGDVRGDVSISFTCDPANRQRLINIALEEVEAMQSAGVREDEIQTVVTLERLQYEESL